MNTAQSRNRPEQTPLLRFRNRAFETLPRSRKLAPTLNKKNHMPDHSACYLSVLDKVIYRKAIHDVILASRFCFGAEKSYLLLS
jgi:hypothetical protein